MEGEGTGGRGEGIPGWKVEVVWQGWVATERVCAGNQLWPVRAGVLVGWVQKQSGKMLRKGRARYRGRLCLGVEIKPGGGVQFSSRVGQGRGRYGLVARGGWTGREIGQVY